MKAGKRSIAKYIPAAIFVLSFIALILKARLGFCWSDETFYSSTAYRFYLGDRPFADEWFPTQLSSVLLLPFLSAYVKITGSTAGIILFFRMLYIVFAGICSVASYVVIKNKRSLAEALAISMGILFYVHLNIATLSYYAVSTLCFLMSMLLLWAYHDRKTMCMISGACLAISVIAIPPLAAACIAFALLALIVWGFSGLLPAKVKEAYDRTHLALILPFTCLGALIVGVIFITWLFIRVSPADIIANVPYLLSDEEHGTSLIYPLKKFFISINEIYGITAYLSYLLILVAAFAGKFIRKSGTGRYIVILSATLLFIIQYIQGFGHTGYVNTALCLFSLPLFFMTDNKDLRSFFTIFAGGVIFTVVYSYSSNGYLYVLSQGHFICDAAGIMFIHDLANECREDDRLTDIKKRTIPVISRIVVVVFVVTSMLLRMINIYRDAPLGELSAKITQGPAKGLYTTEAHKKQYDLVTDTVVSSFEDADGFVLISKLLPFGYMLTDKKPGAYSTWRIGADSERLAEYYEIYPERIPDKILILNDDIGSYETWGDVEADPVPNENAAEGPLYEMIDRLGYEKQETPVGNLYVR